MMKNSGVRSVQRDIRVAAARTGGAALIAAGLLLSGGAAVCAADAAASSPAVTHIRGIYRQRAIELATVGTRPVYLTRMTRFRRCGRFRGAAEDFNDHLVDVAGRDVPGIGFVAGLVDTVEGCAAPGGEPHSSSY